MRDTIEGSISHVVASPPWVSPRLSRAARRKRPRAFLIARTSALSRFRPTLRIVARPVSAWPSGLSLHVQLALSFVFCMIATMKTLFELCDDLGKAEVARRLGEQASTVSRAYHAVTDINSGLIEKCGRVFVDFDRSRTLVEWHARWATRRKPEADAAHDQPVEGGQPDAA